MTTQRYLRLLTYENACKVVEFINSGDKKDYANITTGGVSMQVSDKNWPKVEDFIKSLKVRYEIGIEAPYKVEQQIKSNLRKAGIIPPEEVISEEEIGRRIKGAKDSSVFTPREIAFMCNKKESEWRDKKLALRISILIYPHLKKGLKTFRKRNLKG